MANRIEDIARAAGVSTATVSRAINSPDKVRPKTRQKVEAVISRMGYRPNYFAQALMKGHTDSVGILTSSYTNPYHVEIIDTIGQALSRNGVYIYLCNCGDSPELEKEYTQELIRRNIDALIVIETPSVNSIGKADGNYFVNTQFDCPVILINQHVKPYGDNYVIRCDQKPGIMEVLNQVQQQGLFPFLLFICSDDNYSYIYKKELFKKWKQKNRFSDNEVGIYTSKELFDANNEETVWRTCEEIKSILVSSRPRSILAGNDLMAVGILTAARELSIRLPEELALVGVDNTFLSRISAPPFSTIDLRMRDVGLAAAELYLELKKNPGKDQPKIQAIPSRLYFRSTF
jgi:DNA-binding LacI/PurR family transcriptional regulator